jgi:hypothetical protein
MVRAIICFELIEGIISVERFIIFELFIIFEGFECFKSGVVVFQVRFVVLSPFVLSITFGFVLKKKRNTLGL